MTSFGYLRFLTLAEYRAYARRGKTEAPPWADWFFTHLHVLVEVRRDSLEHGLCLCVCSNYLVSPPQLEEWPISALYLAAENCFVNGRVRDLRALILHRPEVAELILSAREYRGNERPINCDLGRAQDFVRRIYAAVAAREALREIT